MAREKARNYKERDAVRFRDADSPRGREGRQERYTRAGDDIQSHLVQAIESVVPPSEVQDPRDHTPVSISLPCFPEPSGRNCPSMARTGYQIRRRLPLGV